MQINQENGDSRNYLLVEMGDHFDTVLKPRIQKVAYAADWRDGKPVSDSPGQSHMFQYIRLESYEDSLNNLRYLALDGAVQAALYNLPDYFLRYMLDFETAGSPSLLDTAQFERPFQYQLNITRGQVTGPQTVDLVATFNFLLGLRVRTVRRFEGPLQNSNFSEKLEFSSASRASPVVRVLGEDGEGRRVCVLWRNAPPLAGMEAEKEWLQSHVLADVAYDLLYINGESALPDALPIEGEFQRLMFEGTV
jgi:adenine-specific DNA-methyltransferase